MRSSDQPKMTAQQFANLWRETGGRATLVAQASGDSVRTVYKRRAAVEKATGIVLTSAGDGNKKGRGDAGTTPNAYLQRLTIDNFAGHMIVFSDCHYWPDQPASLAHRALIEVIKQTKPKLVIANGDVFDGARISRFPRSGWQELPRLVDELKEASERMAEIRHAAGRARLIRTTGNHDVRFDRALAMQAGEFEGVAGFRLAEHLPAWEECMSVAINGHTMVKHRWHGGVHAAYNNLRSGWSMFTGHTHHLEVKPWADYNRRRYACQSGAIADVDQAMQFTYTEDNPTPWCSGFAEGVFNATDGRLMYPNLCEADRGEAWFRNELVISDLKRKRAA